MLITTKQAADRLNLKEQTLRDWRTRLDNPLPFVKIGRAVKYEPAEIDAYIARSRKVSTVE
jgi:excisionase family DNA binding protein